MTDTTDKPHDTSDLHPAEPVRTYWIIFAWLMGLLILTVIAGRIDLDRLFGGLNAMVALAIATAKALLVILFFMHVKKSSKLTWIFSSAAFVWLVLLFTLTYNDYATRQRIQPQARETSTVPTAPTPERGSVTGHEVK